MKHAGFVLLVIWIAAAICAAQETQAKPEAAPQNAQSKTASKGPAGAGGEDAGFVVRHDAEVARKGPGPHEGKGTSTGYVFFDDVPGFQISFRKRVLHPGASIGYHKQLDDEVYYVIGGTGKMTINGKGFPARAGDAFLTRTGSSHSLEQTGTGDLTVIIVFPR